MVSLQFSSNADKVQRFGKVDTTKQGWLDWGEGESVKDGIGGVHMREKQTIHHKYDDDVRGTEKRSKRYIIV